MSMWYLAYGRASEKQWGTKVQGSDCATLYAASMLLADRYANGEAFVGEYIVAPADIAAAPYLLAALRNFVAKHDGDRWIFPPELEQLITAMRDAIAKAVHS
jgi:hypothetical protein